MRNIISKTTSLLYLYKWIFLLCVPILVFLGFIFYISSSPQTTTSPNNISPTIAPFEKTLITIPQPTQAEEADSENENYTDIEQREDFQKKEIRSDGSVVYTFASDNPQRPNILIVTRDNNLIFSRTLNSKDLPLASITTIKETIGEPEKTIQGSKFYGQEAVIYLYSSAGLTLIANLKTDEVFEEQHFTPMSVDAYLQRFGDQN
jgi:hypothetical protein